MSGFRQLYLLVKNLEQGEKRYFNVYTSSIGSKKEKKYKHLYNLINKSDTGDKDMIHDEFLQKYPQGNFVISCQHLYKVLLRSLTNFRQTDYVEFAIQQKLMESRILFDKGLYDQCFDILDEGKKIAGRFERHLYTILLIRQEVQYLARIDYQGITESELIKKQLEMEQATHYEQAVSEHSALYEILYFRQVNKGVAQTPEEKNHLMDLVMAEMNIVSRPFYRSFEAEKMHLLFQAVYYLASGDYTSSLKSYRELDVLFHTHSHHWEDDPMYYLFHLSGMLKNFRKTGLQEEILQTLDIMKKMKLNSVSARLFARQLCFQYEILYYTDMYDYDKAISIAESELIKINTEIMSTTPLFWGNMILIASIPYIHIKKFSPVKKNFNKILNLGKAFSSYPFYRHTRILNMFTQAVEGNYLLLQYEVTSYEREFKKTKADNFFDISMLNCMKDIIKTASARETKKRIQQWTEELMPQIHGNIRDSVLDIFDLQKWLRRNT